MILYTKLHARNMLPSFTHLMISTPTPKRQKGPDNSIEGIKKRIDAAKIEFSTDRVERTWEAIFSELYPPLPQARRAPVDGHEYIGLDEKFQEFYNETLIQALRATTRNAVDTFDLKLEDYKQSPVHNGYMQRLTWFQEIKKETMNRFTAWQTAFSPKAEGVFNHETLMYTNTDVDIELWWIDEIGVEEWFQIKNEFLHDGNRHLSRDNFVNAHQYREFFDQHELGDALGEIWDPLVRRAQQVMIDQILQFLSSKESALEYELGLPVKEVETPEQQARRNGTL